MLIWRIYEDLCKKLDTINFVYYTNKESSQTDYPIRNNSGQEAAAAKQELVSLQTTVDTLNEQFNLLQIEKETEVDALVKQVILMFFYITNFQVTVVEMLKVD